jgi:hypothetical protein
MGVKVQRAVDGRYTTANEDSISSKFINYMRDVPEERKKWFRAKLDSTLFSFTESAEFEVEGYDCWFDVEGYDDLSDDDAIWPTKGMMASAILEGLAQEIMDNWVVKMPGHLVKPGDTLKSGRKTLSLLMQYEALKIVHTDKELHVWGAVQQVWSGPTNNSVHKYNLSTFKWEKKTSIKLNYSPIQNKFVPNTKNVVFEPVEPVVVQRCVCLPTLLCGNSAASTEIKEKKCGSSDY